MTSLKNWFKTFFKNLVNLMCYLKQNTVVVFFIFSPEKESPQNIYH